MAGENPTQSAALAHGARALFGVQLNDAPVRLGAEDGLAFASAHPQAALELLFWLQRAGCRGERAPLLRYLPLREDPVAEAEHNVRVAGSCGQPRQPWPRAGSPRRRCAPATGLRRSPLRDAPRRGGAPAVSRVITLMTPPPLSLFLALMREGVRMTLWGRAYVSRLRTRAGGGGIRARQRG